jgi:NAD(P)-dependent dehydrogenase (short-subunit alcohol dehydrogenase family)
VRPAFIVKGWETVSRRRLAIVAGASDDNSQAVAERLSADGLQVCIWTQPRGSTSRAPDDRSLSAVPMIVRPVDVSDVSAVRTAADEAIDEWGGVDVLVNNGGWSKRALFFESDERDWDAVIGRDYRGVLATCRYLAPSIAKAPEGRIINLASDLAKVGGASEAVYSGAHAAVVSFSRALAHELADSRTTVNVVCVGTDTLDAAATPLGRPVRPADVAGAVSFLVRPESRFITGQVLTVSGGQTMY